MNDPSTSSGQDDFSGQGGAYVREKDGRRRRVEEPTRDHPEGNRPRDADGRPLDASTGSAQAPAPEPERPAPPPARGGKPKLTSIDT